MKPDLSLIPLETFGPIARAFEEGNSRPGRTRDGWKDVPEYEHYFSAKILRHLTERMSGKLEDDGSGQNPLAHLIADAMAFLWKDLQKK